MTALFTIILYFGLIFGLALFFGMPKMLQDFLGVKKVDTNDYEHIEAVEINKPITMGNEDAVSINETERIEPLLYEYNEHEDEMDWSDEKDQETRGDITI